MPVTWVYTSGQSASGGSATVNWVAPAIDDIGILLIETANEAIPSAPTDWTELSSSPQGTGTLGTRLTAFWKRATSTSNDPVATGDSGDHQIGRIIAFRGCVLSGNPIDATAGGVKGTTSTVTAIPGVNASQGGNDVLYATTRDDDSSSTNWTTNGPATNANLTGLTQLFDSGSAIGNGGGMAAWIGNLAKSGPTGTLDFAILDRTCIEGFMCIALLAEGHPASRRTGGIGGAVGPFSNTSIRGW